MSNVESMLISKVLETGDYAPISDNQITLKYFTGRNRKAMKFIQDFMLNYGKVPSVAEFKRKNAGYEILKVEENINYYCDEVRNKMRHNTLVDSMEKASEMIGVLDTEKAYRELQSMINMVENYMTKSDRVEVNKNTNQRLELYMERSKSGGITGIPTGIDRLDKITTGFNKEELIILIAFTGLGKTWFEAICAVAMAKMGYRVLFFTTEMSSNAIMKRIDAVWCNLNYTRFNRGQLNAQEFTRFEQYLADLEGDEETNLIVEQINVGVSEISAKIDQHQPDMVFVDGAYLLEDESEGEDDWRAQVRIFRGLKRIARAKKVPVFASTQSKSEKANLSSIAFASHIKADADIILGLQQDEEMRQDREIAVVPLKLREGEINSRILMNWKFSEPDGMNYSTLYAEGADGRRADADMTTEGERTERDVNEAIMVVD